MKVFGRYIFLIAAGLGATMPLYGGKKENTSEQIVQSIKKGTLDIRIPSERKRLMRWLSEFFSEYLCALRNSSIPANDHNDPFALTDEGFNPFGYVLTRPFSEIITPLDLFGEIPPFKVNAEAAYLFVRKGLYGKVLVGNFAKRQQIYECLRNVLKKHASSLCACVEDLFRYSFIIAEREDDHRVRWYVQPRIKILKFEKFGITRHEALYFSPKCEKKNLKKDGRGKFDNMFLKVFHLCMKDKTLADCQKLANDVNLIRVFFMRVQYMGLNFTIYFRRLDRGDKTMCLKFDPSWKQQGTFAWCYEQTLTLPLDGLDVLFKDN